MSRRKPGRLTVRWSKRENDWLFDYPRSCDGHLAHHAWSCGLDWREFLRELAERGYDLTTARFMVDRKPAATQPEGEPTR